MQSASSEMLAWMNHKQESRLPQKYQPQVIPDDTPLMTENEKELKGLLMRVKEGKAGLKLSIKKKERKKIMASGPIISWQIEGEKVETVLSCPPKPLWMLTVAMKLKDAFFSEEKLWQT